MKKPAWIRVFGMLSLGGIAWSVTFIVGGSLVYSEGNVTTVGKLATGLGFWIGVLIALPCFFVWAFATIIWKLKASSANSRAGAMAQYYRSNSPAAAGRASMNLDGISLNSPPVVPIRQTGSVFGLTLGQQPSAAYAARATPKPAPLASAASPDPLDIPFGSAGPAGEAAHGAPALVPRPSGTGAFPERSAGLPGEGPEAKGKRSVYTYEAPGLPLCPECGMRPVIFYCRSHLQELCLECVVSHDRPRECVYVPGWRGERKEAH
jgi:hypothetical protein